MPIVDMFDILGEIQPHMIQLANGYRQLFKDGEPPIMIILGSNLTVSEMGWLIEPQSILSLTDLYMCRVILLPKWFLPSVRQIPCSALFMIS